MYGPPSQGCVLRIDASVLRLFACWSDFIGLSREQGGLDKPSRERGECRKACTLGDNRYKGDGEKDAVTRPPGEGHRVVVGMSGGVDSSVAAMLLLQQVLVLLKENVRSYYYYESYL